MEQNRLNDRSKPFDAYYYAHGCGIPYEHSAHWIHFFGGVAAEIIAVMHPRTVLDAGCAMGFLVEALRQGGVEAFGIDISEYAIQQAPPSIRDFCSIGSVLDPFPRHYDLITCIEVLEHMQHDEAQQAVANLCKYTDTVLFSSSPIDYREITHYNVQPPEYWAELFARQGFFRDTDFDGSFIAPWAARFRRSAEPFHRLVMNYERRHWLLVRENYDLRLLADEMRQKLATGENDLRALNTTIAAKEEQLAQLALHLQQREQAVSSQGATIVECQDRLTQQDELVKNLNELLLQKENTAQQLRTELAEGVRRAEALKEQMAHMPKESEPLASQMTEMAGKLELLSAERDHWKQLCEDYSRGKFIRFARFLKERHILQT